MRNLKVEEMTLKTHTIEKKNPQHNQIWEWEETPEVLEALKKLDESSAILKEITNALKGTRISILYFPGNRRYIISI